MQAGQLRHRVTLQRPGNTNDAFGERVPGWVDVATVSASVEPLTGREQFLAAQRQASTTHKVTLRYEPQIAGMDGSWRVLFHDRVFVLDAPPRNIDERNRQVELSCVEGLRQK